MAETHGQDKIETKAIPITIADLTRKAMRKVVKTPPQSIPTHIYKLETEPVVRREERWGRYWHTFGFVITSRSHSPVADRNTGGQPPIARGVLTAPVTMPIPDEYDIPTKVRKRPIPTPLAVLILAGIIFTSQWRIPVNARNTKIQPSRKTVIRASLYEIVPVPLMPTTW